MDFPEQEKKILKFWQDKDIFNKLREKNKGKQPWSFLDGPITANNPMGVHHAWGRSYKDLFRRYKAMNGFDLRYQNGFDCQGLWVEVEVEKELGFESKKDIEEYGIERFVKKCKDRVLKYSKIQTEQSKRLGMWADWGNSYFTMSDENNYAIWHFLKKCKENGFLYKGKDSVPWCPRCGTSISQHEILTEEYKEVSHKAVYFSLPVLGQKNTYFLAWTTTPWTLPGNVALAVHPDLDYAKVRDKKGDEYILLRKKANLIEGGKLLETMSGKSLRAMKYEGLFDDLPEVKKSLGKYEHAVILWKEVEEEEGTGIVHIAPGCGSEDFHLSKENKLPVIDLSNQESRYRRGFGELEGKVANTDEVRELIFEKLKNRIFKIEDYVHRYPVCWRCKSELIFRVVDEWYISMSELREPLIESAKKIEWLPSFGLEREIDWLKNMQDWLISKKRYWGLALPIFECSCGNFDVIGSKEELKKRAVSGWKEFEGHSPHRPHVDKIKIKCSACSKLVSRIPDVGTPWLDAGIVPFSTMGYFTDKKYWQKWFPADFITESFPGQFKNWFYVLLVMSQVLENCPPFKTVLGFATVVDEKGEEMHKSKGNAIWFDEGVERIGADVMRWMYAKQNPYSNMRFGYNIGKENQRKLLTLWNCYTFFNTYKSGRQGEEELLEKWILSRFNKLIKKAKESLDKFDAASASNAIEHFFIEDLSLWYIRRSRKRFEKAEKTLFQVLINLVKLIAPLLPFTAESLYQKIKEDSMPESVHLCDFPEFNQKMINQGLEKQMEEVREIVSLGLAERAEKKIKVRQPLSALKVKGKEMEKELVDLIKGELNVKEVVFDETFTKRVELDTEITPELKEQGLVREIIRQIQMMRKKAKLTPKDKTMLYFSAKIDLRELLKRNKDIILKTTRSSSLQESPQKLGNFVIQKEIKVEGEPLWFGIEK